MPIIRRTLEYFRLSAIMFLPPPSLPQMGEHNSGEGKQLSDRSCAVNVESVEPCVERPMI